MSGLFAVYEEVIEGTNLRGVYSSRDKAVEAVEQYVRFWEALPGRTNYVRGDSDEAYYTDCNNDPYLHDDVISIKPFEIDKPIWTP